MSKILTNLVGKKIGRLMVVFKVSEKGKDDKWKCICDCGEQEIVETKVLLEGVKKACPNLLIAAANEKYIGKRFGRLVIEKIISCSASGRFTAKCQCDCGGSSDYRLDSLESKKSSSCGCIRFLKSNWNRLHGRCYDKTNLHYPEYGDKGIVFVERWQNIENFVNDTISEYKRAYSIDFKDSSKDFGPENYKWVPSGTSTKVEEKSEESNMESPKYSLVSSSEILSLGLSKIQLEMLTMARCVNAGFISAADFKSKDIPNSTITFSLKSLCEKGLLISSGKGKGMKYSAVKDQTAEQPIPEAKKAVIELENKNDIDYSKYKSYIEVFAHRIKDNLENERIASVRDFVCSTNNLIKNLDLAGSVEGNPEIPLRNHGGILLIGLIHKNLNYILDQLLYFIIENDGDIRLTMSCLSRLQEIFFTNPTAEKLDYVNLRLNVSLTKNSPRNL